MGHYAPYDQSELPNGFLNNFFIQLWIGDKPYSRDSEIHEGNYRRFARLIGSQTFRDWRIKENLSISQESSEKILNQTGFEFISEIDETITEVGLTVESVGFVLNLYLQLRNTVSSSTCWEMTALVDAFLLPIYTALRNKGYTKHDLYS